MLITTATDLPRIMQCIGSRNMAAVLPPSYDMTARDEGTAAHYMAQQVFNGVPYDQLIGQPAPNAFVMTEEMADHVAEYLIHLDCGEMEVDTSWSGGGFQINGRADHIKYQLTNGTLYVDDFKYGWRPVSPVVNWTLISHAIGHIARTGIKPDFIVFRIHQPRPYHPEGTMREWSITGDELQEYHSRICAALSNPVETLQTGNECYGCPALAQCPAAAIMQGNAIDVAYETVFNDDMAPEILSAELDVLNHASDVIEARLDALKELVQYKLKHGTVIPNYALENRLSNRAWKKGISAQALTIASGIDCAKPGLITPAEFIRRGGTEAVKDSLTERAVIGLKLNRVDATTRAKKLLKKG